MHLKQRLVASIGLCSVLAAAHAIADQPVSQSALLKRQINGCMTRRMGVDRTLSYNDAMRACKEHIQPAKEAMASIGPTESGAKSH
jgi:hypothetical protein